MKKRVLFFVFFVLFASMNIAYASEFEENSLISATVTATSTGSFSGTVVDGSINRPLSGAKIEVFSGKKVITSAWTNASGVYSVSNIPIGTYTVQASAPHYHSVTKGANSQPNRVSNVSFILARQTF